MKVVSLLLTPADVSLFRDPRPFQAGDTSISSGLPLPQATSGAVRSWLLDAYGLRIGDNRLPDREESAAERLDRICADGHPARWCVTMKLAGPFLSNAAGEAWFPAPTHLAGAEEDGCFVPVGVRQPLLGGMPGWGPPLAELSEFVPAWIAGRGLGVTDHYLGEGDLKSLLNGKFFRELNLVSRQDLCDFEGRLGIGIDSDRNSTREGQIYSASFLRLNEGIHFRVDLQINDDAEEELDRILCERRWLMWGGERKAAYVRRIPAPVWREPVSKWNSDRELLFTTYLATPGIFSGGGWVPRTMMAKGFKLVSAVVGKPLPWSPWDSSRRRHGPTRYAVPSGSMYFWRKPSDVAAADPHGTSISDAAEDTLAGWGFCMRGGWDYAK